MLVGAPVVASRVGGVPSLVTHGDDGLLFEAGDHAGLSDAVVRLLADADLARSLADRARSVALVRHDPARVGRALAAVYRSLAEGVRA
jgi:glycosyltransferase involved in cell wall biosynthesis